MFSQNISIVITVYTRV